MADRKADQVREVKLVFVRGRGEGVPWGVKIKAAQSVGGFLTGDLACAGEKGAF